MNLPRDIQLYIYEFAKPITRGDWRKGTEVCNIYKNSNQMMTTINTTIGLVDISYCDIYNNEKNITYTNKSLNIYFPYSVIRYHNYHPYYSNYEYWKFNYLKPIYFEEIDIHYSDY